MTVTDVALNSTSINGQFEVETDTVHVSWTDSNGVRYGRYENLAWTTETVVGSGGTFDGRTSIQVDGSTPVVSFKVNDGTNTAFKYRRRASANSWTTETTVNSFANATTTAVGSFNELAINSFPRMVSAFFGYDGSDYGLYLGLQGSPGLAQITGAASTFTDMAIAVGPATTADPVFAAVAQSGQLRILRRDQSSATLTLPTSCASVSRLSAAAKDDSTISLAIACQMSGNICSVFYGDVTYVSATNVFTGPSAAGWTSVGTIRSSGCNSNTLTDDDRPSIMVDRQNGGRVSIAWNSQGTTLNHWTNESGSNANTVILTGTTSVTQQTVALDALGKAYIIYKDGDALRFVTNNGRASGVFTNVWSSPVSIVSGTSITGVGTVGISTMKGRGNFTGGK
jgi:hypothetical protein